MGPTRFPDKKSVALLLDPDKTGDRSLEKILNIAVETSTDYILVGGSLTSGSVDNLINSIKKLCNIPVVLFPGNLLQLTHKADIYIPAFTHFRTKS